MFLIGHFVERYRRGTEAREKIKHRRKNENKRHHQKDIEQQKHISADTTRVCTAPQVLLHVWALLERFPNGTDTTRSHRKQTDAITLTLIKSGVDQFVLYASKQILTWKHKNLSVYVYEIENILLTSRKLVKWTLRNVKRAVALFPLIKDGMKQMSELRIDDYQELKQKTNAPENVKRFLYNQKQYKPVFKKNILHLHRLLVF